MELKDIKALQDMGFTLDQIKEVYYPDNKGEDTAEHLEPADQTSAKTPENGSENKKKDSSDGLEEIKNEIGLLKNYIFKQNATENKGGSITPETSADILKSIFNKEV